MEHSYTETVENVALFPLSHEHIECLRNWRNDSAKSHYLRQIPYLTPEMQERWYSDYLQNTNEIMFAIYETRSLNRFVGSLSIYDFCGQTASFGKLMIGDTDAHGKGVGVNAAKAAIQIAFKQLGLQQLSLCVYSDNTPAIKVYQRAGFVVSDIHKDPQGRNEYKMIIEAGHREGQSNA